MLAVCLAAQGLACAANAQEANSRVGDVIEIQGPVGSVIVARGTQSYALQTGDALFEGDRIFTRSNGGARLNANGCERKLEASASIVINKELCKATAAVVTAETSLGLNIVSVGQVVATTGEVGASPNLLGILAAGAPAAAAATAGSGTLAIID
jgi:hypothetical protein